MQRVVEGNKKTEYEAQAIIDDVPASIRVDAISAVREKLQKTLDSANAALTSLVEAGKTHWVKYDDPQAMNLIRDLLPRTHYKEVDGAVMINSEGLVILLEERSKEASYRLGEKVGY